MDTALADKVLRHSYLGDEHFRSTTRSYPYATKESSGFVIRSTLV